MPKPIETETIYQNSVETPIGQIYLAGSINKSPGKMFQRKRVLGRYAIVYIVEGGGIYRDANRVSRDVAEGDMLVLFPELSHSYGPRPGEFWSELYAVFDGPLFDLCRASGLLSAEQPVRHLEPVQAWSDKLRAALTAPASPDTDVMAARARDAIGLVSLLTEAFAGDWQGRQDLPAEPNMRKACEILGADLGAPLDLKKVADGLNLGYESFRKHFQKAMNAPPGHYRLIKRLEAACSLLAHTPLSNAEIAESLGFSDAFHFGRQFKREMGVTPAQYRRNRSPV